jgi:uncharacterized membrane protein
VSFEGFTEIWLQILVFWVGAQGSVLGWGSRFSFGLGLKVQFWVGAQGSGGPKKSKEQNIFIVVSKAV